MLTGVTRKHAALHAAIISSSVISWFIFVFQIVVSGPPAANAVPSPVEFVPDYIAVSSQVFARIMQFFHTAEKSRSPANEFDLFAHLVTL